MTIAPGSITLALAFVTPALALAGALCVAVPIIIHLLTRQRRKPIQWAAMKFLLEAYRKHRRRLTIEQLLLLACRCLLVLFLGLALGRPLLGGSGAAGAGPIRLYLVIDDSLQSQTRESSDEARVALDRHKERAARLLGELDPSRGDRVALVTLGSPARATVLPASSDLGAVGRLVTQLDPTESAADLAGALSLVQSDLRQPGDAAPPATVGERVVVALLTDARHGSLDVSRPLPTLSREGSPVRLIVSPTSASGIPASGSTAAAPDRPAGTNSSNGRDGASVGNVAIVGVDPLRPVLASGRTAAGEANPGGNLVRVRLARFGSIVSTPGTTTLEVELADARSLRGAGSDGSSGIGDASASPAARTVTPVRWQPGQESATVTVQLDPPAEDLASSSAIVARIDRDALAPDNVFVRPIDVRRTVRVAIVGSQRLRSIGADTATIDRFTPAEWIRLALQPGGTRVSLSAAGVEPLDLDPRSLSSAGLAGFDAAIVTAPDELDAAAWRRLREFTDAGGFAMVSPPPDVTIHTWGDAFNAAFGLDWTIAREATSHATPIRISGEIPGGASNPLLGLIASEMAELAKPVAVMRSLAVTSASASSITVIAGYSDGSPMIVSSMESGVSAPVSVSSTSAATSTRGTITLMTTAIDLTWTDLPTKPLMIPLAQEIVRLGVGRSTRALAFTAGSMISLPTGAEQLTPADARASSAVAPSRESGAGPISRRAGVWLASSRAGALSLVSVNADVSASDTEEIASAAVQSALAPVVGPERLAMLTDEPGLGARSGGEDGAGSGRASALSSEDTSDWWTMPLVIGALSLALLEVLLARRFSHIGGSSSGVARASAASGAGSSRGAAA